MMDLVVFSSDGFNKDGRTNVSSTEVYITKDPQRTALIGPEQRHNFHISIKSHLTKES